LVSCCLKEVGVREGGSEDKLEGKKVEVKISTEELAAAELKIVYC